MFIKVKRSVCVSPLFQINTSIHSSPTSPRKHSRTQFSPCWVNVKGGKLEKTHRRPPWWPWSAPCRIPFIQQLELMESTDVARTHLGSSTQIDRPRRRLRSAVRGWRRRYRGTPSRPEHRQMATPLCVVLIAQAPLHHDERQ